MEERNEKLLAYYHQSTDPKVWNGRKTDPALPPQYWYQSISVHEGNPLERTIQPEIGLIGYAVDEGVRRNQGRVGAVDGPQAIREKLGRFAFHHGQRAVLDLGDITCYNGNLEAAQDQLRKLVSNLVASGAFPLVIGGGHDVAFGTGMGVLEAIPKGKRLGILNFDAHFDLRPVEKQPNSGTPFNQLLTHAKDAEIDLEYLVLGIQPAANTSQLFEIARQHEVSFVTHLACVENGSIHPWQAIEDLGESCDHIYVTIDLDGISSAFAPGVSAPGPLGLTPHFVVEILEQLFATKKVVALDIAEMNPKYDQDDCTAKLAAGFIDLVVGMVG